MQVLNIEAEKYQGDADLMYMLHILTNAAADADVRQDMNVEDEYYKAIEDRDTAILQREKALKKANEQLQQRDEQLQQRDEQLKHMARAMYKMVCLKQL